MDGKQWIDELPEISGLPENVKIYPESIHKCGTGAIAMARDGKEKFLLAVAPSARQLPEGLEGELLASAKKGFAAMRSPLSVANSKVLRKYFDWTNPVSLRKYPATVGCGDRLGVASAGHLLAVKGRAVCPVLAQQSIRELTLTGRTYAQVVADAVFAVFESDYREPFGADGDHLKNFSDIQMALDEGMPMITLDLSEKLRADVAGYDRETLDRAYSALPETVREALETEYEDKDFVLSSGTDAVRIDSETLKRCVLMYREALDFAGEVSDFLKKKRGDRFDLEISIDETSFPTLPSHHLFIVRELRKRKVEFTAIAPRFIGEFQKAVDYIGDVEEFRRQFRMHALIADTCGKYKISVHSGSDKFAVFPSVGALTGGRFHLKTAGTSWLVAVELTAEKNPSLYRRMHRCALKNFDAMLKLYHITADLKRIPDLDSLSDAELPELMKQPDARQLLHITYGPILNDPELGKEFFRTLFAYEDAYREKIREHFEKHLDLLGVKKR